MAQVTGPGFKSWLSGLPRESLSPCGSFPIFRHWTRWFKDLAGMDSLRFCEFIPICH